MTFWRTGRNNQGTSIGYGCSALFAPIPLAIVFTKALAQRWASQPLSTLDAGDRLGLTLLVFPGMLVLFWIVDLITLGLASRFLGFKGPKLMLVSFLALILTFTVALVTLG